MNVADYATPGDFVDDGAAFEQAVIDAFGGEVIVPAGRWELWGAGAKWGWRIDRPVSVLCQPGAVLVGNAGAFPGKDVIAIQSAPGALTDLDGVLVDGCAIEHVQPRLSNPQGHGIALSGGHDPDGVWTRNVVLSRLDIGPVGNGDGVYFGPRSEGIALRDSDIKDFARSGVSLGSGAAGSWDVRRGFELTNLTLSVPDGDMLQRTAIRIEPNASLHRVEDVVIADIFAPPLSVVLNRLHDAHVDNLWVSKLTTNNAMNLVVSNWKAECRDGSGGDGAGYCIVLNSPPAVVDFVDGRWDVSPGGAGLAYIREATASTPGVDDTVRVLLHGAVRLNGGHVLRPDLNTDVFDIERELELL